MAAALSGEVERQNVPHSRAPQRLSIVLYSMLLVCLLLGAALLPFGPPWLSKILGSLRLDTLSSGAALLAALLFSVLVHESGHLLAALRSDFEVLGGTIGPFRLQIQHGEWSFQRSGRMFTCSVSAVPREMKRWREKMLWVVGGGPGATLLAAIASTVIALSGPPGAWLTAFWSASAQLNFFLFVLGLFPNGDSARVRNDATLFRALLQNGREAQDLRQCHRISLLTVHAVRPCDYPEDQMMELANWRGRADTNWLIAKTMTDWAIDSGDLAMARAWDARALAQSELCDPRIHNAALASSACLELLFFNGLRASRRKFAEVDFETLFPPCFVHRAKAAHLIANDLPHWATPHILRAQYALPQGLQYYDYERMLLEKLHLKALSMCPL